MQKKRPRSKGTTRDGSGATPPAPGADKRAVRVRSRLVAGVAAVGVIVVGAGAPAVFAASADLTESQRLATLAGLNQQAVTLGHSLADERDAVTAYIAGGRDEKAEDGDAAKSRAARATRVDQQIDEIHEAASASLRRDLSTVASLRRDALTGKGSALEAHQAYSDVIAKLHGIAAELAGRPRRAPAPTAPRSPSAAPPNRPPPPAASSSPRSPSRARSRRPRRPTRSPGCPSRPRTRTTPGPAANATS